MGMMMHTRGNMEVEHGVSQILVYLNEPTNQGVKCKEKGLGNSVDYARVDVDGEYARHINVGGNILGEDPTPIAFSF